MKKKQQHKKNEKKGKNIFSTLEWLMEMLLNKWACLLTMQEHDWYNILLAATYSIQVVYLILLQWLLYLSIFIAIRLACHIQKQAKWYALPFTTNGHITPINSCKYTRRKHTEFLIYVLGSKRNCIAYIKEEVARHRQEFRTIGVGWWISYSDTAFDSEPNIRYMCALVCLFSWV